MRLPRRAALLVLGAVAALRMRAAAQSSPAPVRVGGIMSSEMAPVAYAQRRGLYASAGLDVQLVPTATGAATATAVLAAALEIGKSSLMSLIFAHLRGLPLAVIMGSGVYDGRYPYAELLVPRESPIRSAADLDGRTVGIPSLGDVAQLATEAWVDQNGGDSRTLKYVEIPNSALGAALAQHRVDVAFMNYPDLQDALTNGHARILGPALSAIAPILMNTAWFVSRVWADQHPETVAAFTRVTASAASYLNAHRLESEQLTAEISKIPLATLQRMPPTTSGTDLELAQIQPVIDAAAKYGFIARGFPASALVYAAR